MITTQIPHPSRFIIKDDADLLRSHAAEAEKLRQLHPAQIDLIHNRGWFNLFVPRAYGGLALSLPQALQTEEAIAWADGSAGWIVTLCSGANWFIGFMAEDTASLFFRDNTVCLAGSGRQSGIAAITGNGYEIKGQWAFASGAPHATAFTANCVIEKDGKPLLHADGSLVIKSFVFLRKEVTFIENWNKMGMIATASKGYEVNSLYVDKNRMFTIESSEAVLQDAIYQYPFLEFAAATLAINSSGMAMRFIDLAAELFDQRNKEAVYKKSVLALLDRSLEASVQHMQMARQRFYEAVQASWDSFVQHRKASPEQLHAVRSAGYHLAKTAREVTDELYPLCGLSAANTDTEINRVWRNLHTASQHALLSLFMAAEI